MNVVPMSDVTNFCALLRTLQEKGIIEIRDAVIHQLAYGSFSQSELDAAETFINTVELMAHNVLPVMH